MPGGQQGATIIDRAHTSEHDYEFVNFLHDYSERPLDLPSWHDEDRPSCTGKRHAHIFALQLSRARSFHSGQAQTGHAEIPFAPNTGEQIREGDIYLSCIPVRRTEPPQELEDYVVYHRLAHHGIEWCGILLDPPVTFHPGPAPVAPSDDDLPNTAFLTIQ